MRRRTMRSATLAAASLLGPAVRSPEGSLPPAVARGAPVPLPQASIGFHPGGAPKGSEVARPPVAAPAR